MEDGLKRTAAVDNAAKLIRKEATIFFPLFSWKWVSNNNELKIYLQPFRRKAFQTLFFSFMEMISIWFSTFFQHTYLRHSLTLITHLFSSTFIFICVPASFIWYFMCCWDWVLLLTSLKGRELVDWTTAWVFLCSSSNNKNTLINVQRELIFTGIIKSHWRISRDFNRHILFYCHWRPLTHSQVCTGTAI